ncbi:MAG TPA: MauE/DoxX family redox-associated membrane protein [Agriterribacter sp.]|nr:MauE/DoxX family redox-associated membrane protein [Agriterribacter sp.]
MTHTYNITGMTCGGCEAKVKSGLLTMPNVLSAQVSKSNGTAIIKMDKHIPLSAFQAALGGETGKYKISAAHSDEMPEQASGWVATYKPILLIFVYILGITLFIQWSNDRVNGMQWMSHFMAGFFLIFSFFKLLNLKGFAESYAMYDIVGKQWRAWGYVYAFIELFLGVAYLTSFNPLITNGITFLVMSVSMIGVLQSVMNRRKIKCACLGDVFNLPMSTITIIEDALMIGMSVVMLLTML